MTASTGSALPPPTFVIARYGELVLKGKNRPYFEKRLVRNVKAACKDISTIVVQREHGQLILRPEERTAQVARRLREVFGISVISPAWEAQKDPESIARLAVDMVGDALLDLPARERIPFRVQSKRADKRFPLTSMELDHFVADRVFEAHGERLQANMREPRLTLGIAVRNARIYLFAQRVRGAGGLPIGTIGKALSLLSGGIDSPVASWMAMRRGLHMQLVTFESAEFLGREPEEKVRRLAGRLARWQPVTRLFRVPFSEVQLAVRDSVPESFRTVIYRRMMQRIATKIAEAEGAGALVTGDSLGQVASQTLENLGAVGAAATLPVLRPLIAMDKQETIDRARQIGTYDLSVEQVPDCCTVFQPSSPTLRATPEDADRVESGLDIGALVQDAFERTEQEIVPPSP